MGATLDIERFDCKRSELEGKVDTVVSQDAYEDGSLYGGGWASKGDTSLTFHPNVFLSHDEASEFIENTNQKAMGLDVVRVVRPCGKRGYAKLDKTLDRIEKLGRMLNAELPTAAVLRAKQGKSKSRSCTACGKRHALESIRPYSYSLDENMNRTNEQYHGQCPTHGCNHFFLYTKADLAKAERYKNEIAEREREVEAIVKGLPEDAPCFIWVVGGWCPS